MRIVHRPHFVRTRRKRRWPPRFGSKSLAPATLHRQTFLPVQPIHSLVVNPPPKRSVLGLLPSQENVQSPVAESRALGCQLAQPSPQRTFVPFSSLVSPAPTVHPDQPTGASLTEPCFFSHDTHRFSFRPRAYHFFASTIFSAKKQDRKSTRLNSSHQIISYAVFCLKKKRRHPQCARLIFSYS